MSSKQSLVVGLTGGIASGKSTVALTFAKNNIPNVDADIVSRDIVMPGTIGHQSLIDCFGSSYLNDDGTINRKKLGDLVFHDDVSMKKLNSIMGPLLQAEVLSRINTLKQIHPIVIYNAALLCENGQADKYRPLIMVRCTAEQQLERLMKRGTGHGPLTKEQAMAIINVQMPMEKKMAMADFIIDTSGTIEDSVKQTEVLVLCLKIELRNQMMIAQGKR